MNETRPEPTASGPVASRLEIDLEALDHNVAAWRKHLHHGPNPTRICAVIKADAYGLGVLPIARRLDSLGVEMFSVYGLDQALTLLRDGLRTPILLLIPQEYFNGDPVVQAALREQRLQPSVHDMTQLRSLNRLGEKLGAKVGVHLYIDTGMSRGGFSVDQVGQVLRELPNMRNLNLTGLYTHFATSDSNTAYLDEQHRLFVNAIEEHRDVIPQSTLIHVANTCAAARGTQYHHDMVRIGLGLLGFGPDLMTDSAPAHNTPSLKPVMRWVSDIRHIHAHLKGETVGYNRTHTLERDSVLGLVPVGYADGYPVALSNRSMVRVFVPGERTPSFAPVLGRVSMDQVVIDLTDVATHDPQTLRHAAVELISNTPDTPTSLPTLADQAQTHCYELLCRISNRIERIYLG